MCTQFLFQLPESNVYVVALQAPQSVKGYSVSDLSASTGHLSLVYSYNEIQVLCRWAKETNSWQEKKYVKK